MASTVTTIKLALRNGHFLLSQAKPSQLMPYCWQLCPAAPTQEARFEWTGKSLPGVVREVAEDRAENLPFTVSFGFFSSAKLTWKLKIIFLIWYMHQL